jgi:hypothetical protein
MMQAAMEEAFVVRTDELRVLKNTNDSAIQEN